MSGLRWTSRSLLIAMLLLLPAGCGGASEESEGGQAGAPATAEAMPEEGEASMEMEMGEDGGSEASMPMAGTAPGEGGPVSSQQGLFELRYAAETDPIMVNAMHSWVVNLQSPEGEPIEGAAILVAGDMPAHGHGLPTQPEMTEDLGGGDYRIEGLKFQMGGYWELYLDVITPDGQADRVVVPLQFQ